MPSFVTRSAYTGRRLSAAFLSMLVVGVLPAAAVAVPAPTAPTARLPGHVLPALHDAKVVRDDRSSAAGDAPLLVTLVLKRDDEAGFERHLHAVRNPVSPVFGRFLGAAALADRFGPSRATYETVAAYLRDQGLDILDPSPTRLTIGARGTRTLVERAFGVAIRDYEIGDRRFFANDGDPALPADLAPHVQAVTGLSNLAQPRPVSLTDAGIICSVVSAIFGVSLIAWWLAGIVGIICFFIGVPDLFPPGFPQRNFPYNFTPPRFVSNLAAGKLPPADAAATFGNVSLATGAGQTVAITSFSGFDVEDVRDWLTLFGEPERFTQLQRVSLDGGASVGPDQTEVLLDVAAIMSTAPDATVVVYDRPFTGTGSFQALFDAMIADGVDVISNSWAYCENQTTLADVQSIDVLLQTAAAAGIGVFTASGDRGTTCLNGSPNTAQVPASSPHVTAVGGSTLTYGPGFTYGGETWWDGASTTPPTGQGGFGVSRFFTRPAYQDGLTTQPTRSIPDVVVNANPATGYVLCQATNGGCPDGKLHGGTSVAAPIWAAFAAVLNEANGSNLGFLNPLIYPLAGTDAFHDAASMGSDFAHVGLGSPNLDALLRGVSGDPLGMSDATMSDASYGGTVIAGTPSLPLRSVPADGATGGVIVVQLRDADGHTVSGKTVALEADSAVTIVPANATTDTNGAAAFTVTSLAVGEVTFTATDTTDGVVLVGQPVLTFGVPPAANGGIQAFPTTVPANGTSTTTITVTLQDALARPAPGKEIRLTQGTGHSIIAGPNPPVTDAAGQIQFTATNRVNEVVTYAAIDVTDGDLPVPGSVQITYDGASTSCIGPPPVGQNGYLVTSFATGFVAEDFFFANVNWDGCPGASNPAFRGDDVFIANFRTGGVYRFGLDGGAVSSANVLATLGQTLGFPAVGKDGKLYATFGSTGVSGATGSVVELDPETGAVVRTLAANQKCPSGLAVDPLSGDLFFTHQCFGVGLDEATITRVRNPASMSPTVETYATLPLSPNGQLAFAPNGTLYAPTGYTSPNPPVIRIAGTDTPAPPAQTPLAGVSSIFTITIVGVAEDGEATALLGLTLDGLHLYDLTTDPPTATLIATDMGSGVIGPDGCMYAGISNTVFRVAKSDGTCAFTPSPALPSLTLAPTTVAPDPAQGTAQTFTATFRNLAVPAGTPVLFRVSGTNSQARLARTDAAGEASFTYAGALAGIDAIVATATIDDESLESNAATVNWTQGKHTTFMTLNPSATGGVPGLPSVVSAALLDTSVEPAAPVVGQTITFMRGTAECSGVTDAQGVATCVLLAGPGSAPLTAVFAGTPGLLPATESIGFNVLGGVALSPLTVYQSKQSKGTPKFVKFGPVTLADELAALGVGYDVQKLESLAVPAGTNGGTSPDPDTHLTSYVVKRAKGAPKFVKATDVRLLNQCSDSVLTLGKPASLLLPTAKDLVTPPVAPTDADHSVDHFLCYKAKQLKKRADGTAAPALRKGLQVDVADQFQTTRYDLGKVVLACNPVDKSGTPILQGGPTKGAPFPITPATVRNPASHLLCYRAKIATKRIEQNGCGPATPGDKGTKIVPKQAKHLPRLGVHLANQFGAPDVDTKKATLVCIPSVLGP